MSRTVADAFQAVPRVNFLPDDVRADAGLNIPLPIGYGQTNSQPETVEQMLEWLEVQAGQHILDIGSGSGWTTALLAYLVGPQGHITAVEIVPELVEFGSERCRRLGISNVSFHEAGTVLGWPSGAPYDNILVSASAKSIPEELIDQLSPRGRIVIPVLNSIFIVYKNASGHIQQTEKPGFIFVPLL